MTHIAWNVANALASFVAFLLSNRGIAKLLCWPYTGVVMKKIEMSTKIALNRVNNLKFLPAYFKIHCQASGETSEPSSG